jgi:diguanylate cyclase (GGDEF)-like protein
MDTEGFLYLVGRGAMAALCITTAALALRVVPSARGTPRTSLLALALLLGAGAWLSVLDAWRTLFTAGGRPILDSDWAWFAFDLGVPVLAFQVIRLMRQRDAALARLDALAATDPLTGLTNRRGFDARTAEALGAGPAALLALDLDRFKAINDGHGHAAGDAVLKGVAAVLSARIRQGDILARIGGEEFAALLPATDLAGALDLAERLRRAIPAEVAHPAGAGARVTVSIGVATVPPGGDAAHRLVGALAAADAALYAAKRNGRDRVEASPGGRAVTDARSAPTP